jgi:formylglycine-generating enzyme required for sulfatase activity
MITEPGWLAAATSCAKLPVAMTSSTLQGMRLIEGGTFTMGSEAYYPEERPLRRVKVDPFWIDEVPVTNFEFARFVESTGYRTVAEIVACCQSMPSRAHSFSPRPLVPCR